MIVLLLNGAWDCTHPTWTAHCFRSRTALQCTQCCFCRSALTPAVVCFPAAVSMRRECTNPKCIGYSLCSLTACQIGIARMRSDVWYGPPFCCCGYLQVSAAQPVPRLLRQVRTCKYCGNHVLVVRPTPFPCFPVHFASCTTDCEDGCCLSTQ